MVRLLAHLLVHDLPPHRQAPTCDPSLQRCSSLQSVWEAAGWDDASYTATTHLLGLFLVGVLVLLLWVEYRWPPPPRDRS